MSVLLGILLLGMPIYASMTICFPKWWKDKIGSKKIVRYGLLDRIQDFIGFDEDIETTLFKQRKGFTYLRYVWVIPVGILLSIVSFCMWYYFRVTHLVTRKCPYSNESDIRRSSYNVGDTNLLEMLKYVWTDLLKQPSIDGE